MAETPQDPIRPDSEDFTEEEDSRELEIRMARLQANFDYIRRDLDGIRADQKTLLDRTVRLPTTGNLWTMIATMVGISAALIALFVGILTYLQSFNTNEVRLVPDTTIVSPPSPGSRPPSAPRQSPDDGSSETRAP